MRELTDKELEQVVGGTPIDADSFSFSTYTNPLKDHYYANTAEGDTRQMQIARVTWTDHVSCQWQSDMLVFSNRVRIGNIGFSESGWDKVEDFAARFPYVLEF